MNSLAETLKNFEKILPPLASAVDLVNLGIFPTISTVNRLRILGKGPAYLKLSERIVRYPKDSVIKFLKEHWNDPGEIDCENSSHTSGVVENKLRPMKLFETGEIDNSET